MIAVVLEQETPTSGGCIEWPYALREGYGVIFKDGARISLHRLSYEIANSTKIPDGMVVRHSCDNPPCFNPQHLLLGTFKDNTWDSVLRGRNNHGERHHFTPFTEADIVRIRTAHAAGQSIRALARETGVARNAIANIVYRRSWKHVA